MHGAFVLNGNIVHRDPVTGEIVSRAGNLITSGGLSLVRDFLAGDDVTAAPSWIVYGSGTVLVGRFMTQVPGETFRTRIVGKDKMGSAVMYHWFVSNSDNVGSTIGCYGLVGGDASLDPGTGTLLAIANEPAPFSKGPTNAYSGDWQITVSGVTS